MIMILFGLVIAIVALVAMLLLVRTSSAGLSEGDIREAILECFSLGSPGSIGGMALEADWVALRLRGMKSDTRILDLPLEEQAEVRALSERVIGVAAKLVDLGFLRLYPVAFANQGRNQVVKSPRSLFCLTPKGVAVALAWKARRAKSEEIFARVKEKENA